MRSTCFAGVLAGGIWIVTSGLVATGAHASPSLAGKSCPELMSQRNTLKTLGVERDMAKGAAWARANLSDPELQLIKLFIEIGERLRFKCTDGAQLAKAPDSPVVPAGLASPAIKPDFLPPLPVKRLIQIRPAPKPPVKAVGGVKPLPVKTSAKPPAR